MMSRPPSEDLFDGYRLGAAYDEMFEAAGRPRPHYQAWFKRASFQVTVRTLCGPVWFDRLAAVATG